MRVSRRRHLRKAQDVFHPRENAKLAFSNSYGFKSVSEKLRDGVDDKGNRTSKATFSYSTLS